MSANNILEKDVQSLDSVTDWRDEKLSVKSKLEYILQTSAFHDVTFHVGKDQVPISCHRFMLVLCSKVFESMFNDSKAVATSKEADGSIMGEISIPHVEPRAFKAFLKFLYTDEVEVELQDIMPLMYVARKFSIPALISKCFELLKTTLHESNAVTIFQIAEMLRETDLCTKSFNFILQNINKVIKDSDFLNLSHENLCRILRKNGVLVKELDLFHATVRWAEAECSRQGLDSTPENLRTVLNRAINLIRFPLMTAKDFSLQVCPERILSTEENLMILQYISLSASERTCLPELMFQSDRRDQIDVYTAQILGRELSGPSYSPNQILVEKTFRVDRSISIFGFGFHGPYTSDSTVEIKLKLLEFETKKVLGSQEQTESVLVRQGQIYHISFDVPVPVQKNVLYKVKIHYKAPGSYYNEEYKESVTTECGIGDDGDESVRTVTFSSLSENAWMLPEINFII